MIKKISFIIFIIFFILLINSNTIYAVSTKEDINKVKELIKEQAEKDMKEWHYTEYRSYVLGEKLYTDPETGKQYPSSSGPASSMAKDSETYKMEDIAVGVFKEYLDKYLSEEVPEEERLVDYFVGSFFPYTRPNDYKYGDDIEVMLSAFVCPVSENSVWGKNKEKVYVGQYDTDWVIIEGYNTEKYYLHLVYENEKYVIKYMDTKPEGYDDFVERMKKHDIDLENMDYAKLINAKSEKEIIAESAEVYKLENLNSISEIEKINVLVIIIFSSLILITLFIYLRSLKKSRKNIL